MKSWLRPCFLTIDMCRVASGQHRTSKFLVILIAWRKVGEASLCATPTRNATKEQHSIKGRDYTVDLAWPRLGAQPAKLCGLEIMDCSDLLVSTQRSFMSTL